MKKFVLTVGMAISLCVAMASTSSNEPCCSEGKCENDSTCTAKDSVSVVALFNDTIAPCDTIVTKQLYFALTDSTAPVDTATTPSTTALVAMV